ncbi:MAG: biliverdin-producing heme oxygenase [Pseudomonadota bacterium]
MQARVALREATADCHDRVDAAFSVARLDDSADYGRFLQAQAAAFIPCELALDRSGADAVLPDWSARRRADLLTADLGDLGMELPAMPDISPFIGEPAMLGAVYVLEGSRLGGAMLKRSVQPGLPTRFLSAGPSIAWRNLIHLLDERLTSEASILAAIDAARSVFSLFESSGSRYLTRSELGGRS